MSQSQKSRNRAYGARAFELRKKADTMAEKCGAEVAVICYREDGEKTLFHGKPRYISEHRLEVEAVGAPSQTVVEAHARALPPPRPRPLDAFHKMVEELKIDEMAPPDLVLLEDAVTDLRDQVEARIRTNI